MIFHFVLAYLIVLQQVVALPSAHRPLEEIDCQCRHSFPASLYVIFLGGLPMLRIVVLEVKWEWLRILKELILFRYRRPIFRGGSREPLGIILPHSLLGFSVLLLYACCIFLPCLPEVHGAARKWQENFACPDCGGCSKAKMQPFLREGTFWSKQEPERYRV